MSLSEKIISGRDDNDFFLFGNDVKKAVKELKKELPLKENNYCKCCDTLYKRINEIFGDKLK